MTVVAKPFHGALLAAAFSLTASAANANSCAASTDERRLAPPSNTRVYKNFGPVRHPLLDKVRLHAGWDYDAPLGAPVQAAAGGRVVAASYSRGYGNLVVIDHGDGLETAYAHLKQIDVTRGACIEGGARVGAAGSTGLSARPHLHFEVRKNGEAADPAGWLGRADKDN